MLEPRIADAVATGAEPLTVAERAIDDLLDAAYTAAPYQLPALLDRYAEAAGIGSAALYLVDLQHTVLVPYDGAAAGPEELLSVDGTLAGRAYQLVEVLPQPSADGGLRIWLPLLDGSERIGVLCVTLADPDAWTEAQDVLRARLRRLAALAAQLVVTKTLYGDTLVGLRRRTEMGLPAEIQWSLLPPLTFACDVVTVAAALEPAYEVAGDTVDYAVNRGHAHVGIFDGMGHGLQSAQLASLAVAAYRRARRAGATLVEIAQEVDGALLAAFGGEAFSTAVLAELDTDTGRLQWVDAGHPEPLLLRNGRLVKTLAVDPSPPLGLSGALDRAGSPAAFAVGVEQLEPGDRVLLYTDGVTEARSPDGEFFGVERLADLVTRNLSGGLPTPETLRRVVRSLLEHQQGRLNDDATLLLLEWRSGNGGALQIS